MTDIANSSSRNIAHIALFSALVAALGLVPKVDLAFGIPITMQSLGAMLAGALLGPRKGMLAIALFLIGVLLGLPLLAGGRGGPGVFVGPTVGFLFGWLAGAGATGLVQRTMMRHLGRSNGWPLLITTFIAAAAGGLVVVYAMGIVGLALVTNLPIWKAAASMLVFVPGDLIKCAICAAVVQTVARGLPSWRLGQY